FVVAPGIDKRELLALAATAEQYSEHPIAYALINAAKQAQLTLSTLESFEAIPGYGVKARVSGTEVHIGANHLFEQLHIDVQEFRELAQQLATEGKTPIYIALNHQVAGVMALADTLKPGTAEALRALHDMGFNIAMISGDNRRTAEAIAKQLAIDLVIAEVLPEQKVN